MRLFVHQQTDAVDLPALRSKTQASNIGTQNAFPLTQGPETMTILHIDSSARIDGSVTRDLTAQIV
ncbi:MAG: hypothetical protein AAFY49_14955, partial [Pseudomonadota bacterium]